jgi:hypothetical protein
MNLADFRAFDAVTNAAREMRLATGHINSFL